MFDSKFREYIKSLTSTDKKSLSQKGLKVCEEAGELAKVILPFDNAPTTLHRFVEKRRILEEVVDVMLTSISIAYELGYTDDDIEEMFGIKAEKWHGLQAKETKLTFPIPFEIHVTVKLPDTAINLFKEVCGQIGVKPIVIELEKNGENVMRDVMTSSHFFGTNAEAYHECVRVADELTKNGFDVVRKKIETIPWHPAAPTGDAKMPQDCYFESHISCVITPEEKALLSDIAQRHDGHLSKNFFKKLEDGKFVNMITLRWYQGNLVDFMEHLDKLKKDLTDNNVLFEKTIVEFSIYDTKINHDFKWLEK
jgi:NTP pyrophosphatase (non-canonical NTP hydrolase)